MLALALFPPRTAVARSSHGDKGRGVRQHVPARQVAVERFSGKVVRVSDGDTCDVESAAGKVVRIRIYGIDAPELSQEFGKEARKYLDARIFRQEVMIEKFYDDQYGRCVGKVLLESQDIALELLREGMVWHYIQYSTDPEYATAERLARRERKGLWKAEAPVAPWEYRKAHPRRR